MGRREHAGARGLGRLELGQPQSRAEGVDVNHVGSLAAEPGVEALGAAHRDQALTSARVGARGTG